MRKQKPETQDPICGTVMNLFHDKKIKKINFNLIRCTNDYGGEIDVHYVVDLEDWTSKDDKVVHLVRFHIKDLIDLKSVIDNLVYEALNDETRVKK